MLAPRCEYDSAVYCMIDIAEWAACIVASTKAVAVYGKSRVTRDRAVSDRKGGDTRWCVWIEGEMRADIILTVCGYVKEEGGRAWSKRERGEGGEVSEREGSGCWCCGCMSLPGGMSIVLGV